MKTTTPLAVTETIREFCRSIDPNREPIFIPVKTSPGAEHSDCFVNVEKVISQQGGSIQFGWTFWEWPGMLLEGEFHAVHEKDGTLTDVSPHEWETQILFLPSDLIRYDRKPIDNQRMALSADPRMRDFIAVNEQNHALRMKYLQPDGTSDLPFGEYVPLENRKIGLIRELGGEPVASPALRYADGPVQRTARQLNRELTPKERAEVRKKARKQKKAHRQNKNRNG